MDVTTVSSVIDIAGLVKSDPTAVGFTAVNCHESFYQGFDLGNLRRNTLGDLYICIKVKKLL